MICDIGHVNVTCSVTDPLRPGQAYRVMTPEGIAAVEAFVNENRCVTVNEMAAHLDMSHGSAHQIVHDVLQFIYIFIYLRFSFDSFSYIYRQVCLNTRTKMRSLKKFSRRFSSSLPLSLANFWVKRQIPLTKWNATPTIKKKALFNTKRGSDCTPLTVSVLPSPLKSHHLTLSLIFFTACVET